MNNGHPYAMNGAPNGGGYADSEQGVAGPSSAASNASSAGYDFGAPAVSGPPHLRKRTSSLQSRGGGPKGRGFDHADGLLGDVARWTQDQSGLGQRTTSRMLGNGRWGNSPPPMAPPPLEPPPLPPGSHPYAAAGNQLSGPGPFARAAAAVHITPRKSSVPLPRGLPNAPPPSSALPPAPFPRTASPLAGPGPSTLAAQESVRHNRQSSLASYRSSNSNSRSSASPPASPLSSIAAPSISPRTSSLDSPSQQAHRALAASPYGDRDATLRATARDAARMPSRQLLQSALDLAQRAVEMDRNNDTQGALDAYQEAVTRLRHVMERVGVEPSKNAKGKRPGSGGAEDEGRTLRGIHDAYVQRIQLLLGYGKDPDGALPEESEDPSPEPPTALAPGPEAPASRSTATLVPARPPAAPSSGDRTPRGSIDHSTDDQMARMAISDPDATLSAPSSPIAPVAALGRPISSEIAEAPSTRHSGLVAPTIDLAIGSPPSGALQRALDDVTVQTPDLPHHPAPSVPRPSTPPPPSPEIATVQDPISPTLPPSPPAVSSSLPPTSPTSVTSPSRIQKLRSRTLGIDQEAGLPDEDPDAAGDDNIELLGRTPQAPSRPSTSGAESVGRRGSKDDKALPPIPPSASSRGLRRPIPSFGSPGRGNGIVSSSTSQGTISQRRLSRNTPSAQTTPDLDAASEFDKRSSAGAVAFPSSASIGGIAAAGAILSPRARAQSQPSDQTRPDFTNAPPLPAVPRKKASLTFPRGLRINVSKDQGLMPPAPISSATPRTGSQRSGIAGSLISPLPEAQPSEVLHRPFHILRIIHRSMDDTSPGVYLTGAIHISSFVWRPPAWSIAGGKGAKGNPPPKIVAQDIKFRVIHQLLLHLTIIKSTGAPLLDGLREFRFTEPGATPATPTLSGGQIGKVAGELEGALEALEEEMEGAYKLLTKSGVGVGSWKGKAKRTGGGGGGWGNSLKSKVGSMAKEKVMDSPEKYVDVLETLCAAIQVLDHHLLCITGPCTPAYHAVQPAQFHALETRLTRCAEFVGAVVVPFVLDDLKQFFLRYLKGGIRYLED